MNTKPLLLSATILALLTACGGSGGDTQTLPEQPQTPVPPGGTPPPSPTPPPPPFMKPVPDYAQNMSTIDEANAFASKVVQLKPPSYEIKELKNNNVDSARLQFLHIEWPTPSDILA